MKNNEVRKLPKRTKIIIIILILAGFAVFMTLKVLKEEKISEILSSLNYKNIKDLEVINKLKVEDKETRYKSNVYKVRFYDNNLNKMCIGFVHIDRFNKYSADLDCK